VIDLVHIRVDGSAPGSGPKFLGSGIQGIPQDVGVCGVIDLEFHADIGQGSLRAGQDGKRGVIAGAAARDDDFVAQLCAFRSSGELAVFNSETCRFEEAQGSSFSSCVFFFGGHFRSVDRLASDSRGERDFVVFIGGLRSCP